MSKLPANNSDLIPFALPDESGRETLNVLMLRSSRKANLLQPKRAHFVMRLLPSGRTHIYSVETTA
jgi:hypothetical protein